MTYELPQVTQRFNLEIVPADRDRETGALDANAVEFLERNMVGAVHRFVPQVGPQDSIEITIKIKSVRRP